MDIAGFVSIGVLIIIQICLFAFGYGKLSQNVSDINTRMNNLCDRLDRIDHRVRELELKTAQKRYDMMTNFTEDQEKS